MEGASKTENSPENLFFIYLSFLSRPFTNYRTAGEGGGHFFNSSLPLPLASQDQGISYKILHIKFLG